MDHHVSIFLNYVETLLFFTCYSLHYRKFILNFLQNVYEYIDSVEKRVQVAISHPYRGITGTDVSDVVTAAQIAAGLRGQSTKSYNRKKGVSRLKQKYIRPWSYVLLIKGNGLFLW